MADIKRKLATIEKIKDIQPIPNADAIEVVTVRGWKVVVKKDEFKINDLCIYIEIDSIVPEIPEFEFLKDKKYRVKTIKLRGQVSQGIVFPISILYKFGQPEQQGIMIKEGEDITDFMGIIKYEPPIPAQLSGQVKGSFPSYLIKSDEERVQNLDYEELKKYTYIETEKLDGTSSTYSISTSFSNDFEVCSRNLNLKEDDKNTYWKVARELDIENKMKKYMKKHDMTDLVIQGEIIGEGIQKNPYKIKGQTIRIFIMFDPKEYKYFSPSEIVEAAKEMDLETVPIINDDFTLPNTIDELLEYVQGYSKLRKTQREGSVFVAKDYNEGNNRFSFKVISNKYLLKNE